MEFKKVSKYQYDSKMSKYNLRTVDFSDNNYDSRGYPVNKLSKSVMLPAIKTSNQNSNKKLQKIIQFQVDSESAPRQTRQEVYNMFKN